MFVEEYKKCSIWKVFVEKSDTNQITFVENLVDYALPLLKRFSDTFPRYTDHGGRHQINILNIISNLLGDKVSNLSSLEASIIILSTFYHDIGMVYTEEERNSIDQEIDFLEFIKHDANAELQYVENNNRVSQELGEWYCRWAHAKRVYLYLNRIESNRDDFKLLSLNWNNKISIRTKLGLVCESHNWPVEKLKSDDFDTSFLNQADLRFCAILLRLGDVLDFDYSRAEESIYYYLKLNNANSSSTIYSKKEWEKHIDSQGFIFPAGDRNFPYEIKFIAAPNKPSTEKDIRDFLDYIDVELGQCNKLLQFCSDRWRNIHLPDRIYRTIISQGYQSGEFKFTLDQKQVLNLLMGEEIYEDKYVFIRELLQNALDTTRHRAFYEKSSGHINFEAKPIDITSWIDNSGHKWIRFDDYGMGMSENIINKYLLKVGSSYYNSAEFKVEKLGYKNKSSKDFTPISRFGIGLLSCFIVGDHVEISTWKRGSNPIRLSITGLHNYYVLQTGSDIPNIMPSEAKYDEGYRVEEGTSIAVRMDTSKESKNLNLELFLEKWLFTSNVSIKYKGKLLGGDPNLMEKPIIEYFEEYLDEANLNRLQTFLGHEINDRIGVLAYPIDLTAKSLSPYLKGQFILLKLILPKKSVIGSAISLIGTNVHKSNHLYSEPDGFRINISKETKKNGEKTTETLILPLPELDKLFAEICLKYKFIKKDFVFNSVLLIHNDITIDNLDLNFHYFSNTSYGRDNMLCFGFISLYDELRPKINVARSKVEKLSWSIWSQIEIAFADYQELFNITLGGILDNKYWNPYLNEIGIKEILQESIESNIHLFNKYLRFKADGNNVTFDELKNLVKDNILPIIITIESVSITFNLLSQAVLRKYFNIVLNIVEVQCDNHYEVENSYLSIINSDRPVLNDAELKLYPLFFIKFQNSKKLCLNGSININHQLGNWLRENFVNLSVSCLGFLNDIVDEITSTHRYNFHNENSIDNFYSNKVQAINDILTRIMQLTDVKQKISVSYDIFITVDDFYFI